MSCIKLGQIRRFNIPENTASNPWWWLSKRPM